MKETSRAFQAGLRAPLVGLSLIRATKGCRLLAASPYFIYLLLFALGLYLVSPWVAVPIAYASSWVAGLGILVAPLSFLIAAVVWILAVIALTYAIFLVARVLAAPFHGLLAERILKKTGALPDQTGGLKAWARLTVKMTLITIIESFVFLLVGIVLFLLSFVPGLNLVAGFVVLLIMAFDSADYSFEVLGFGLRRRFGFFFSHIWFFAGLATAMGVTLLIPFLNFLLFPAAVAGSAGAMKRLLEERDAAYDSRRSP